MWLPRIIAKARLLNDSALPPDYEARFCHHGGVDGQFLAYFGLTREDIVSAARLTDEEIGTWIHGWAAQHSLCIDAWNHVAVNLGRQGFPMAERLPVALATSYAHLDAQKIQTVFEALEADEAQP